MVVKPDPVPVRVFDKPIVRGKVAPKIRFSKRTRQRNYLHALCSKLVDLFSDVVNLYSDVVESFSGLVIYCKLGIFRVPVELQSLSGNPVLQEHVLPAAAQSHVAFANNLQTK